MDPQTFIFAGPSGSGKGTQVELLREALSKADDRKQFHFYTGDHFRAYMKNQADTLAAQISTEINSVGGLQPPFLAIWLWAEELVKNFTGEEHLIIDGTPRTITEAQALDSAMKFYKRKKPQIILIDVSVEEAKRRLLERARTDDTEEGISNRLSWYESEVKPAIDIYREDDYYQFHEINGEQSVEEVHQELMGSLALV
ncbi:MAG: nucleoside monophosphate kinase [Candidatus Paceibacterota bacterium]